MHSLFRIGTLVVALSLAPLGAVAADAPDTAVAADASANADLGSPKNPWRGSSVGYEHSFAAIGLDKGHDLSWNPAYVHTLTLMPQWHFEDLLVATAMLSIEQELTRSDWTKYDHQVYLSDLSLLLAPEKGWTEENTGIKVGGALRFIFPTSEMSQTQTLNLGVAPGLSLSRKFDVLKGLTLKYAGSFQLNWHRYTTAQYDGPRIQGCASTGSCAVFQDTFTRNVNWMVAHGPSAVLGVVDKLQVGAEFSFRVAALYPMKDESPTDPTIPDPDTRYLQMFRLYAGYDLLDYLSLEAGALTFGNTLNSKSETQNPFFNRDTQIFFGASIDVDTLITPEKKPQS